MVSQTPLTEASEIFYPESDGQPMADNTEQFRWIVVLKENLEWLFADDPTVFVAGDLLWYPVEGRSDLCTAPDAMVVIGRPKGKRGSYQQWKEDNLPPQVVFEILSPSNTKSEMSRKLLFYDRYGVEEYYLYDPDKNTLNGWRRQNDFLEMIEPIESWESPRLGIRFDWSGEVMQVLRPDGKPFLTYVEVSERLQQAEERAEQAEQRAEQLAQRLRELGVDPEQI